jgi:hypothetical protein
MYRLQWEWWAWWETFSASSPFPAQHFRITSTGKHLNGIPKKKNLLLSFKINLRQT